MIEHGFVFVCLTRENGNSYPFAMLIIINVFKKKKKNTNNEKWSENSFYITISREGERAKSENANTMR